MIFGRTATFVRSRENHEGVKHKSYTGIVLDKFRGYERIAEAREFMEVDYYLVELEGGVIQKFFPDEMVQVLGADPSRNDNYLPKT